METRECEFDSNSDGSQQFSEKFKSSQHTQTLDHFRVHLLLAIHPYSSRQISPSSHCKFCSSSRIVFFFIFAWFYWIVFQLFRMLKPGKRSRSVTPTSRGERLFQAIFRVFFFSHSSRIGCSCKMLWEQLWNVISPSLFFILSATALMGYDNALKCAVDCGVGNADLQLPKRKIVPCDVFLLLVMI